MNEDVMGVIVQLTTSELGQSVILWVVGAVVAWLMSRPVVKAYVDQYRLDTAGTLARSAVQVVYDDYVRFMKASAADGKLDDAERVHARKLAMDLMQAQGLKLGVDLFKLYGPEFLQGLVNQAVTEAKKDQPLPLVVGVADPELPPN